MITMKLAFSGNLLFSGEQAFLKNHEQHD